MSNVEIPYGAYWSTPFSKWQGSLQHLNSVQFAAWVAKRELEKRSIAPEVIDAAVLGISVPQNHSFYGTPWMTGMMGIMKAPGTMVSQACASGVRAVMTGAHEIQAGLAQTMLVVTADRCSNGPHLYYPAPNGPGGTGEHEDWVLDNFSNEPLGGHAMLNTAENVAARHGFTTAQQHDLVLRRYEQYTDALANDNAFQKRYMTLPFEVPARNYKKTDRTIAGDEGVFPSTAEGLAKLKPVIQGGTVTFGGQTHPADGNAALIVAGEARAKELSRNPAIRVEMLAYGQARAELAYMPEATLPAAHCALKNAGLTVKDIKAVKTHNPFAVNDLFLSRELGFPLERMNNYGSSLIWGHPQAPTGARSIIELIEELVIGGGGIGLFTGCAAGDSAMSVIVKVSDRK